MQLETIFKVTSRVDKSSCSIVKVIKVICGMLEVKNDLKLYMKVIVIQVLKENNEMFLALKNSIDQIARHK